jgi:hypothetical protein
VPLRFATDTMPKLFEFAFFPAAKDADKFHLLRLDQLASLLNVNHKDSMFLDDRGVERPYQDLDKYIFYSYERISLKHPESSTHLPTASISPLTHHSAW